MLHGRHREVQFGGDGPLGPSFRSQPHHRVAVRFALRRVKERHGHLLGHQVGVRFVPSTEQRHERDRHTRRRTRGPSSQIRNGKTRMHGISRTGHARTRGRQTPNTRRSLARAFEVRDRWKRRENVRLAPHRLLCRLRLRDAGLRITHPMTDRGTGTVRDYFVEQAVQDQGQTRVIAIETFEQADPVRATGGARLFDPATKILIEPRNRHDPGEICLRQPTRGDASVERHRIPAEVIFGSGEAS